MKTTKTLVALRRLLAAVTILTLIPLVIEAFSINTIPTRYLAVLLPLYGLLTLAVSFVVFFARPPRKIIIGIGIALALLMSTINIVGYRYLSATNGFMSSIQQANVSYTEYSVIAKKGSAVSLDSATNSGIIATDQLRAGVLKELSDRTTATPHDADSLMALFNDLVTDDATDIATLRSATLDIGKEYNRDLYDQVQVIATFKVKHDSLQQTVTTDTSKPFALYISGIDTYGAISTESRSDVNMLAVVNPESRRILLINTPRDYYVQLHGTIGSKDKLTHAGIYGVDMSRQTLEDLYDIDIPYYIRVNFSSLMAIVDTIGGVSVYSDYAFGQFHVGRNELNGKQALQFSRERYSFTEGDRQRGRNQQRVIEAIVAKLSSPSILVNYSSILSTTQSALQTNLPPQLITSLVNTQLASPKQWVTRSISVDGTGSMSPTYSMGAQPLYVMIPNEASLEQARQEAKSLLQ